MNKLSLFMLALSLIITPVFYSMEKKSSLSRENSTQKKLKTLHLCNNCGVELQKKDAKEITYSVCVACAYGHQPAGCRLY